MHRSGRRKPAQAHGSLAASRCSLPSRSRFSTASRTTTSNSPTSPAPGDVPRTSTPIVYYRHSPLPMAIAVPWRTALTMPNGEVSAGINYAETHARPLLSQQTLGGLHRRRPPGRASSIPPDRRRRHSDERSREFLPCAPGERWGAHVERRDRDVIDRSYSSWLSARRRQSARSLCY